MASWCLGEINVCPIIPSMFFFYHMASSDKQVFPSLEFIGWYSVAPHPTARHIALHEQVLQSRSFFICPISAHGSFTSFKVYRLLPDSTSSPPATIWRCLV